MAILDSYNMYNDMVWYFHGLLLSLIDNSASEINGHMVSSMPKQIERKCILTNYKGRKFLYSYRHLQLVCP